jgi:hypothetical protein
MGQNLKPFGRLSTSRILFFAAAMLMLQELYGKSAYRIRSAHVPNMRATDSIATPLLQLAMGPKQHQVHQMNRLLMIQQLGRYYRVDVTR